MGKPKIITRGNPKEGKFAPPEKLRKVKKLEIKALNSNQKPDCSVLREFSVRIKRIPKLPKSSHQDSINTLKAQCKINEKLKNFESQDHLNNKTSETNDVKLFRKSRRIAIKNHKNINSKVSTTNSTKAFKNISAVNNGGATNIVSDKPDWDVDPSNKTRDLYGAELKTEYRPKTQSENQAGNYMPNVLEAANTKKPEEIVNVKPLIPRTTKKCFVKLVRIRNTAGMNKSFAESSNKNKRSCVVLLKKLENSGSMSSDIYFEAPVIDNNKRNNFRKLSLSKPFRNLMEDGKPNKNKTLSHFEKDAEANCNRIKDTEMSGACNEENQLPRQKTSQKNDFSGIQKNPKLSLKKPTEKTNTKTLQNRECERHLDSLIVFEPTRNSTLLGLGANKNKQQEKSADKTKQTSTPQNRLLIQNLANKSDEIEKVLNSLDDEEDSLLNSVDKIKKNNTNIIGNGGNKTKGKQINTSSCHNKTNKFFHSKNEKILTTNLRNQPAQKGNLVTSQDTKQRRLRVKRSSVVGHDNVYEFLSQSQTSDSGIAKKPDPTADVIKKLIQAGKVQVATNFKGKGKPKFKRPAKRTNKIKRSADKNSKKLKKEAKKVTFVENNKNDTVDRFDDGNDMDNDDMYTDHDNDLEQQNQVIPSGKNIAVEQEGTFSSLARRALINQAGRSELLQAVRNIISTPKNKKLLMPQSALQMDISPIAKPSPRNTAPPSPWRVNDDAYLPKTFNFCRSSGNLPSFSSDFIPSTPRKEKSKVYLHDVDQTAITHEKSPVESISNISLIKTPLAESKENNQRRNLNAVERSTISSFSSNDSNAENMPPPTSKSENCNQNDRIFDSKQFPNPRRAFNHRSPLKTINILEVVHLPPYKCPNKTKNSEKKEEEINALEGSLNESLREGHTNASINTENPPKENLFGFEDYISQTDISSQEDIELKNDVLINERNQTIHEKLQDLRKLKPDQNELQKSILTKNSANAIKTIPIFDDNVQKRDGLRQRCIKDMLCSTMLDTQPSTSKRALPQLTNEKSNIGNDLDLSELFKDPEPEITFNENEFHRTYIRPYKRKRRLKENQFVMFLDSDESENEEHAPEKQKASSPEKAVKKKRPHKETKENPELTEFVEEFNELCKEVESFELVVEKSV